MEERHLNIRKVIITVVIFVFAFLIIFLSALLTKNSTKSAKKKDFTIRNHAEVARKDNSTVEDVVDSQNQETNNQEIVEEKDKTENVKKEPEKTTNNNSKKNNNSGEKLPVYKENASELVKAVQNSTEKNVYLTFDDGPSPHITPQILEILKEYNVPATFFVLGSRAELYPELVKQEYEAGHYIANHGYSHKYSSIYSSVQAVIDEYNDTERAIQNALGNSDYHSYLFRFPGGSSGGPYNDLKAEAKAKLNEIGIASTNWNCLTGDAEATGRTKQQLINELYDTAKGWNTLVILMHDADDKQATVDALPEIIEHYMNEGYRFKNYYEVFQ